MMKSLTLAFAVSIMAVTFMFGFGLGELVYGQECPKLLQRPVTYGMRNNDVKTLQVFLISNGFEIPAGVTGYYGDQTRAAVNEYQVKYSFQILYPLKLTKPTGNVYSMTLNQINLQFCSAL